MMKQYWKYHIWEMLILWLTCVTSMLTFSQGFYISDNLADSVILSAVICLAALLYCYIGNYNRQTMIIFIVGYIVIMAVVFLIMSAKGVDIIDEEGSTTSNYIYLLAALILPALFFVLSRTRIGIAVLFILGIYCYALNDFLHFEVKSPRLMIFVIAAIALFLLRQYRVQTLKNSSVDPKFMEFSISDSATSIISALLGVILFFIIIQPLAPPTLDLKTITKYLDYEVLEMIGITQKYQIPDELLEADQDSEEILETNEFEQNQEEDTTQDTEDDQGQEDEAPLDGNNDVKTELSSVSYLKNGVVRTVLLIILLILLIAGIPFAKHYYRKKKIEKMRSGTAKEQIIAMYKYLETRFGKIGFPRDNNLTEYEYSNLFGERTLPYTEGVMGLQEAADLYVKTRYGDLDAVATEENCSRMADVYPALLSNYRKLHGNLKYALKYFIL